MQYEQAQALLANVEGCTFAALDTETVPTLRGGKKNPFQGKLVKRAHGNRVMLFTNKLSSGYENKVRRHLERVGKNPDSFEMGKLPWGQRIPNSPFIEHNGQHYLQCVFLEAGEIEFIATESFATAPRFNWRTGDKIPKTLIEGLPERTGSEHQGLDKSDQVIVRTFKLDSILALRAMGEELK